jgi:CRISPR/Cas system-associated exonuclease Cas4 (RecB family)
VSYLDTTSFRLYDEVPVQPEVPRWLGHFTHLSPTSLGMFRRCPRQFYMRYILGKKEAPGESLVIGSMFHETLEFNYSQKIESHEDKPLSEIIEYLQDAAVPKVLDEAGGEGEIRWDHEADTATGVARARSDAERISSAYHTAVVPRIQPIAVERRFEWHPDGFPVPMIGYLDTITDAARVLDTKTGKQVSKKVKPSWQLQGLTYANATGFPVEFHSISRAKTPSIATALESEEMVIAPNLQQKENLIKLVKLALDQIAWYWARYGDSEEWPATGRLADWSQNLLPCKMCAWQKDCPAWAGESL